MSDSSSDPVTDDGHRRAAGALWDVPVLQTRLTREYSVRHPFVGAGMGFIAHEQLAAAVTNAGGLGVLGASPDPPDSLPIMVERLRTLTSGPFGVDLICADTGLGPASTDGHIDACVQLHGGIGVTFEHDLHLFLRRVTVNRACYGTPAEHQQRVGSIAATRKDDAQ